MFGSAETVYTFDLVRLVVKGWCVMEHGQRGSPYLCLTIVGTLGLVSFLCVVGLIVADWHGHQASPALVSVIGTCVGSLASFLVSVPRGSAGVGDGKQP